jgi:hypothetical protein
VPRGGHGRTLEAAACRESVAREAFINLSTRHRATRKRSTQVVHHYGKCARRRARWSTSGSVGRRGHIVTDLTTLFGVDASSWSAADNCSPFFGKLRRFGAQAETMQGSRMVRTLLEAACRQRCMQILQINNVSTTASQPTSATVRHARRRAQEHPEPEHAAAEPALARLLCQ